MLDSVELRHVAAFLSPFEDGAAETASDFASSVLQRGLLALGPPIVVPPELQPEFELVRQRLLDEAV